MFKGIAPWSIPGHLCKWRPTRAKPWMQGQHKQNEAEEKKELLYHKYIYIYIHI